MVRRHLATAGERSVRSTEIGLGSRDRVAFIPMAIAPMPAPIALALHAGARWVVGAQSLAADPVTGSIDPKTRGPKKREGMTRSSTSNKRGAAMVCRRRHPECWRLLVHPIVHQRGNATSSDLVPTGKG